MNTQRCMPCEAGSYSLGSSLRFDQWDVIPAGFTNLASFLDQGSNGEDVQACNRWDQHTHTHTWSELNIFVDFVLCCSSSWTPQGVYLESNRDECTVSLVYAVHLERQGSVSFTYQYPDNNIFFEFYVSLDYYFSLWGKMASAHSWFLSKQLIRWCGTYFKVQNEQCQEMVQTDDQKWIKVTNNGGWDTHIVSTCSCW